VPKELNEKGFFFFFFLGGSILLLEVPHCLGIKEMSHL
jgi:hypothetical protein